MSSMTKFFVYFVNDVVYKLNFLTAFYYRILGRCRRRSVKTPKATLLSYDTG
jgi:hypothetical protein